MVVRRLFTLVALLALAAPGSIAQEVGLTARTDRHTVRMGEPVFVSVEARASVELDSIGPMAVDSVGMFEVLSITREESRNAWTFELMTIDTGSVFLSPLSFGYVVRGDTTVRTAYANSLMFTVSGVDVAPDADIKDIKPPMNAPWGWGDVWPYLLAAAIISGGWIVYRKYFSGKPVEQSLPEYQPPAIAPHLLALQQLRDLEERKVWQQGKIKEYYSECTEIVRRFFEGRWGFPALEQTSDEILHELSRVGWGTADPDIAREFFQRADMVKFAKRLPTPDEHAEALTAAYGIVRSMTPPEPVESEKEEADVAG